MTNDKQLIQLSELKASDMVNKVPCIDASGRAIQLQERHHASYLRQMYAKYGDFSMQLVDGVFIVQDNITYLCIEAGNMAYRESEDAKAKDLAHAGMDSFYNGIKTKD